MFVGTGESDRSEEDLPRITALVRKHHSVFNEEEARDVVFRMDLDGQERRQKMPWGLVSQNDDYSGRVLAIYEELDAGSIGEEQAISKITVLMEEYYEQKYPLGIST